MPTFNYTCEVCGRQGRASRDFGPPRFCSNACKKKGQYCRTKPHKHPITEEAAARIRATYQGDTGKGEIRELAKALKIPRWKITRFARGEGLIPRTKREPEWSERELRILAQSAHRSPERIQIYLKRVGFKRSVTAIVLKRKRMRFLQNLEGQSARQLSGCFGVDVHCITRWIHLGYLRAMKRETKRTEKQGGDIYLIRDSWVRDFVVNHVAEVDFRKVDKYWLVDILAGGKYGTGAPKALVDDVAEEVDPDEADPEIMEIFEEAANF